MERHRREDGEKHRSEGENAVGKCVGECGTPRREKPPGGTKGFEEPRWPDGDGDLGGVMLMEALP